MTALNRLATIPRFTNEGDRANMSTAKKRTAGKRSGVKRAKIAVLRRFFVLSAFERLKAIHRIQPFSLASIDALVEEFRRSHQQDSRLQLLEPRLSDDEVVVKRLQYPPSERSNALLDEAVTIALELKGEMLASVNRETLIKDLKALGIRSKNR